MGGTTFESLKYSTAKVFAVESSHEWLNHMKKWSFIRKNIQNGRLKCLYIDIGKTKDWGFPVDNSSKDRFPKYSNVLSDKNVSKHIDVVLIDGRFRVACGLNTILNCSNNTIIMIHDFPSRKYYHVLLKYLDTVETAGELCVFKIKNKIIKESVERDYENYKYNSD